MITLFFEPVHCSKATETKLLPASGVGRRRWSGQSNNVSAAYVQAVLRFKEAVGRPNNDLRKPSPNNSPLGATLVGCCCQDPNPSQYLPHTLP
jgi:hypothetical protein